MDATLLCYYSRLKSQNGINALKRFGNYNDIFTQLPPVKYTTGALEQPQVGG